MIIMASSVPLLSTFYARPITNILALLCVALRQYSTAAISEFNKIGSHLGGTRRSDSWMA
jgi:hypothetical protein